MGILDEYITLREAYTNDRRGQRPLDEFLDKHEASDLETLATFAADSITHDRYETPQPYYIWTDLTILEKLYKTKNISHPNEILSAVNHLFEDYLKPPNRQKYQFGHNFQGVIAYIEIFDLQRVFDLRLLDRAIEKAGTFNEKIASNWKRIRDQIAKTQIGGK